MNKLKDELRLKLLGQLSSEKTELDVDTAFEVCKDFTFCFISFLRENYHTDKETWTNGDIPLGFHQDKKTYDTVSTEELYNKFLEIYDK
jgi:hypothetical protein